MFIMKKKLKEHSIILLLLTIGFLLRIKDLGTQSLWFDESISSIAALAILEKGVPILDSGLFYGRAILNTFLIAISFKIFGMSEFAGRLPSVLFGTLTIYLVYIIGSKWGNKRVGVFAALLVAFSVWEIAWSRQARMYQQLQFFYILSLYFYYEFWTTKNVRTFLPLVLSFTATLLSHNFGYSLVVVFLLYSIIFYFIENRKVNISVKELFPLAIAGILVLLFVYHKGIISSVIGTEVNYYNDYIYLFKKDLGIFLFAAVPGGTIAIEKDWKKGLLLVLAVILPLYVIFFHVLLFATRYLYFVVPILFIFISIFLDFLIGYLQTGIEKVFLNYGFLKKNGANIFVLFLLLCSMSVSSAFTFTPQEKYDLGVNAPQSDFKEAYLFVENNWSDNDVIISTWTAPAKFYLGKNDYWLAFNVIGTGMESFMIKGTSQDVYTNSTAIKDVQMLENVTRSHEKGWIVVDNTAWYKLSEATQNYIETNIEKRMTTKSVRVYSWNNKNQ